jgi:uncharacterized membrane protein
MRSATFLKVESELFMLPIIIFCLVIDTILLAVFMHMPVSRKEEAFFGVRVSPEVYNGVGRSILKRYRFWMFLTFIEIETIGLILSIYRNQMPYARIVSQMLLIASAVILHMIFYRQVKIFEIVDEKQKFASSLKVRRLGDYTNIALEVLITLLTLLPIFTLIYFYPFLPDRIPVHWNWKGEPDRWARKSFTTAFFVPTMTIYLQGLFLLFKHGILQSKMTLPAEHTEEYLKGKEDILSVNLRLMDWVRFLITILLGAITVNLVCSVVNEFKNLMPAINITIAISGLLLVAGVAYYIYRLVKIDSELKKAAGRVYVQRQRDAEHWYGGGFFYYNPEDPSLFVEKMVGYGYTLNMGNRRVYIYIAYLGLIPLLLVWAINSL